MKEPPSTKFEKLPAGRYYVFVLGRGASRDTGWAAITNPNRGEKDKRQYVGLWQSKNESLDYRGMVFFGLNTDPFHVR